MTHSKMYAACCVMRNKLFASDSVICFLLASSKESRANLLVFKWGRIKL